MNNTKKILLILLPIAVLFVIGIVSLVFTNIAKNNQTKAIDYDDTIYTKETRKRERLTQEVVQSQEYVRTPTNNTQLSVEKDITDWQDSQNIKQSDYTPYQASVKGTSKNQQEESSNITEILNSYQTEIKKAKDSFIENNPKETTTNQNLWGWVPTTKKNQVKAVKTNTEDKAIRDYGNDFGSIVKRFTSLSGDQTKVLTVFMGDYASTEAQQKVYTLGEGYQNLHSDLVFLNAPTAFSKAGADLALAYHGVGDTLLTLSEARNDTDALKQIYAYNKSVEVFATSFLKMVTLFGAYGVQFSNVEGGSIFMPPASAL